MSCQVRLVGNILDIRAIRRCLFPNDDQRGSDSWLQLCEISVSPVGDIITIANERRLVVLSAKWDSQNSLSQFHVTYSGNLHESDSIKAVLTLPIASQGKNPHVDFDWTCIALGFDSGYVRFYTENCELLLEEQFHCENITSIKCQSQHSPKPNIAPELHQEEIYIQYQSNVCVINGSQLFPLLRNARTELARAGAKKETFEYPQGNITPKKWGFQDQATINDIAVVGINLHGHFDHLLTASTCGGFETKYRFSAPLNNLVLAAGSRPFLGYHYALEGCPQPIISDMAKAVASKLKSALPGWLTGKSAPEAKMSVAMQPADTMGCRFGLCDLRRTAASIILSTDHRLAAVSDALGRVLLLDAYRGVVLRIFKGYRDAQCSFIQIPDERHSKHRLGNKVATFLIIYSPKKGTLEVFTVQQGVKVTTFTASKFSQLIYNNYNLFGFNTTSKSRFCCDFTTLFIDNDGQIKELLIPFHYALNEKNNKRARDIHLYKKLRQLLRNCDLNLENVENENFSIIEGLKTAEYQLIVLEFLLGRSEIRAETVIKCVQYFVENLGENELDADKVNIIGRNTILLLNLYIFVRDLDLIKTEALALNSKEEKSLNLDNWANLQRLLDLSCTNKVKGSKIVFADRKQICGSDFVSLFDLRAPQAITLKPNCDSDLLLITGQFLFDKFITQSNLNVSDFEYEINKSTILINDIFTLLINYWVKRPLVSRDQLEPEMNNFLLLIWALVKHVDPNDLIDDDNYESKFWTTIRNILAKSERPFSALTAAILCRIVSQRIEQETVPTDDDNLEFLSNEKIEWSLLIGKLEDLSLLNIILTRDLASSNSVLPKLKHDSLEISLNYILEKGRGSVSELAAKWLTKTGIDPQNLVVNDNLYRRSQESSDSDSEKTDGDDTLPDQRFPQHRVDQVQADPVFEQLNLLRPQFPYSLDCSYLLANMCWEYGLAWKENVEDLCNLEACIKCLKYIPQAFIGRGLHYLVWNTYLKIMFEATSKLVNKVGKLPKEKLCKQDTRLSDMNLVIFLANCRHFLDNFMAVCKLSARTDKPTLKFEHIWENGPQSLVELAQQQATVCYDLLHLHYQLSVVLEMIVTFPIKQTKAMQNLFESYMLNLFFLDLTTTVTINWNYADSRVQQARLQFLFKVIAASLETVSINNGQIYVGDHNIWIERVVEIAELWNLDLDEIYRHHVIQGYNSGLDTFAQERIGFVKDRAKLASEMLAVAGRRLLNYLDTSDNYCRDLSVLTTAVTRYMEKVKEEWSAPSTLEKITTLLKFTLVDIDKVKFEYKLAEMMLDGCETISKLTPKEDT